MGFSIKKKGNKEYLYYYLGNKGPYYLAPKDNPQDVNVDNVLRSLDYVSEKYSNFTDDEVRLIELLPTVQKDQYLTKRIESLYKTAESYVSSLSDPELKRQYSGDRTKLRQEIEKKVLKELINNPQKIIDEIEKLGLVFNAPKKYDNLKKSISDLLKEE